MNEHDELMKAITSTLETAPSVDVPQDFSARLMAQLPQQLTPRSVKPPALPMRPQYGWTATLVALLLLLAGMVGVAAYTQTTGIWNILEWALFLQFCGLMIWVTLSRRRVF